MEVITGVQKYKSKIFVSVPMLRHELKDVK